MTQAVATPPPSVSEVILNQGYSCLKKCLARFEPSYRPSPKPDERLDRLLLKLSHGGSTLFRDREMVAVTAEASFRTAELMATSELNETESGWERLELVIQRSHIGGAVATWLAAEAHYEQGNSGHNNGTGLLTANARCNLKMAVSFYQRVHTEFRMYENAFKTQSGLQKWLRALYLSWAKSCELIALDAYNRGEKLIGQPKGRGNKVDIKKGEKGLREFGNAIEHFTLATRILNETEQRAIKISKIGNGRAIRRLEKEIARITSQGFNFAEAIGKPELALTYLLNP